MSPIQEKQAYLFREIQKKDWFTSSLTIFSSFVVLLDPGGYIGSYIKCRPPYSEKEKIYLFYIEFGVQKYPTSTFTGLFFGLLNRVKVISLHLQSYPIVIGMLTA